MFIPRWLRLPHRLIVLFLLITLVPSLLLMAFGWRLLTQDRQLRLQQAQERREQAADLVVAALEQSVSAVESALRDDTALRSIADGEDAVVVVFQNGHSEAFPPRRLVFYPHATRVAEPPSAVFAVGEDLEVRQRDPARAAQWFRHLARSHDPGTRAGALFGLARNLRKTGARDRALDAYAEAGAVSNAVVAGVPADLLARWARCDVLAELGRTSELRAEAETLYRDLVGGKWPIDRPTFELHATDAKRWLGDASTTAPASIALSLSVAVQSMWDKWRQFSPDHPTETARESRTVEAHSITILWHGNSERLAALFAGPEYVERHWRGEVAATLDRQHVRITLRDALHRAPAAAESRRVAADTGLPWTVAVESLDPRDDVNRLGAAQIWWLAALVLVTTFVAAGTYVIARAISRELVVGQLQTDFVAAVSHEFRTPLTSLRQLTEMLLDRTETPESRRREYYAALARQTERLHRLVESLLDFGRMEAGTSPYRKEAMDARAFIESVVEQFAPEASRTGHHIELQMNGLSAQMKADRDALTHALWNVLDNAVKYSPGRASVTLEAEQQRASLLIHVRDQGMGIAREEQQEIFHKFVRGSRAKTENIKGTGIGLAMVQHIVRAHGGSVSVESAPEAGSTFTIRLPIEESCPGS